MRTNILATPICPAFFAATLVAQNTSGSLRGKVQDISGARIAAVTVEAEYVGTGQFAASLQMLAANSISKLSRPEPGI